MNIFELLFFVVVYLVGFFIGHYVALAHDVVTGAFAGFFTTYLIIFIVARLFRTDTPVDKKNEKLKQDDAP